jgi:heme A synthase
MNQQQNQLNLNLHMQRIVTLIIGAVILIFLFLPWLKKTPPQGYQTSSYMGFAIWGGIVCAVGVAGVIVTCLMGDRLQPFTKQIKVIAMVCFGIIVLFAIIVAIASSGTELQQDENYQQVQVKKSAGIGAWLTLVAGVAGLLWVSGLLNQLMAGRTTSPASFSPPTAPGLTPPTPPGVTPPTPPGATPPPPPPPPSN